nr:hypothetical protein [Candidatus Sigynarchaeota archaeon]
MPEIKIIKTIQGLNIQAFEKALKCDNFWKTCIVDFPRVDIKKKGDDCFHFEISIHMLLDPLGITKIPIDIIQDLRWKADATFAGEGMKWDYWVEHSTAVSDARGHLYFKQAGNDMKLMIEVTKVDLKGDFLNIANVGKSLLMIRLEQELQKMVMHLIGLAGSGKFNDMLATC